jgi:WD40 repeat protein
VRLLDGQGGSSSVTFSLDGTQVAAGGDDGSVMVWNADGGDVVARLENHLYPVTAVAWAHNHIASGDPSGVVRVWDTGTWSERLVLPTEDLIRRLFFHTAGTQLTAFSGSTALTWAITGEQLSQGEAPANLG